VRVTGAEPGGTTIGLVHAANARDLGGYPTMDGRRVRRGLLFRSSALHRLDPADQQRVADLGLRCVLDFRHPREIELVGADRLPTPPPGLLVSMPLFDLAHDVFTAVSLVLAGEAGPEVLAMLDGDGAVDAMIGIYRWLSGSVPAGQAFGAAIRLIAEADALPMLFHCTAGKDRTGWLAATLLHILGVSPELIEQDYLLTNRYNAEHIKLLLHRADGRLANPEMLRPLLEARSEYLAAALHEVDQGPGSFNGYLRGRLGLDQSTLDALADRLLEPPA
jgi:protein-tyrosine phosphatase